jgi:hypothetical protein
MAAPLLVFSVGLHGLLLFVPVPSRPAPEVEEVPAEEEFVDLLSIGTLPEPVPEVELPEAPLPEAPPPAPAAAAIAPTPPMAPDSYPATPPPEQPSLDGPPPAEPNFTAASEPTSAGGTVRTEEVADIFTQLTRGSGESDFDSTETAFPYAAYGTRGGIGEWSPQEQSCFFTQIDTETYSTQPGVISLRYLTRNVQFIVEQDIPRTFPAPTYQVSVDPSGFCNRPLFQVFKDGQPHLFISVAGVGVGAPGQQASGLVVIWASDPRAS